MSRYQRRNKLPKPSLQLRLTLVFVGLVTLTLMIQYLLLSSELTSVALELPNDGLILVDETNRILLPLLLLSFLISLPMTVAVGVLTTFRVAGPIYRYENYLRQLARGEDPGPCRIRGGDQLQELCDLLNQVTEPIRGGPEAEAEAERAIDEAERTLEKVRSLVELGPVGRSEDERRYEAAEAPRPG